MTTASDPLRTSEMTGSICQMDRRALMALLASLPVAAAGAAEACIVLPFDAAYVERQNERVRGLFDAWWSRNRTGFRKMFTEPLNADGTPLEPAIVEAWRRDGLYRLPDPTRALFRRYFADRRTSKRINYLINTHLGVVVACSESTDAESISQCEEGGQSHLFFVEMGGINPRSVSHLNSGSGGEEDRFIIWRNDAS